MFQKLSKMILQELKLELHIMPALKYGKISHMEQKAICGLLAVSYTKWLPTGLHSLPQTFKSFTKKL